MTPSTLKITFNRQQFTNSLEIYALSQLSGHMLSVMCTHCSEF